MAWGYCLNMEKLSIDIIEDAVSKMTDSNYEQIDNYIKTDNGDEFIANLKWGTMAVIMICSYVESSTNSLLRDYLDYPPDGEVLKSSIETKLEIIFSDNQDRLKGIKGDNCWDRYKRTVSVRNHLIHYKNNSTGRCSSWPLIDSWRIGREILGDYFTRSSIQDAFSAAKRLVCLIAESIDVSINPDCHIIGCDARFGAPSYFCSHELRETILEELKKDMERNAVVEESANTD